MSAESFGFCLSCRFSHVRWREGDTYIQWYAGCGGEEHKRKYTAVECRRHAPRFGGPHSKADGWPLVRDDDWCGEFEASP